MFELAAGFLFGIIYGSFLVLISKTGGGCLGFLVGRYFFREKIHTYLLASETFRKFQDRMNGHGWKFAFFLSLSPVPSWAVTYGLSSLGKINFWDFFLATLFGSVPYIIQNVYIGTCAHDLATLENPSQILQGGFNITKYIAFPALLVVIMFFVNKSGSQ